MNGKNVRIQKAWASIYPFLGERYGQISLSQKIDAWSEGISDNSPLDSHPEAKGLQNLKGKTTKDIFDEGNLGLNRLFKESDKDKDSNLLDSKDEDLGLNKLFD
jgi:hypothetical protein